MHNLSSSYSPVHSTQSQTTKNKVIAAPTYSFTQKTTTVSYPWPPTVTGLERIALSAQGDLQRVLSAFFARPISIAVIFEKNHWHSDSASGVLKQTKPEVIASVSPNTPIIQTRQVHLQCSGKVVCKATSTIRMTSPNTAHLFLVDKYAIGQTFRRLEKLPVFELLSVGLGRYGQGEGGDFTSVMPWPHTQAISNKSKGLWRRYKLSTPGFECDIVEVFPDRDMFLHGEAWLDDRQIFSSVSDNSYQMKARVLPTKPRFAKPLNTSFLFAFGFFLILFYELSTFLAGGCLVF